MKLMKLLIITFVISFAFGILFNGRDVYGETRNEHLLQDFIKENNYISAEKAIKQYEEKYQKKISLPKQILFEPTHRLGKVTKNGNLVIHYMSINKKPHQDFILNIMSPETKIDQTIKSNDEIYTLKDGNKAFYRSHNNHLNFLLFKKNELVYIIGGSNKQNKKYSSEKLIKIAESLE